MLIPEIDVKNVSFVNIVFCWWGRAYARVRARTCATGKSNYWGIRTNFISEPLSEQMLIPEMGFKHVGFVNIVFGWRA